MTSRISISCNTRIRPVRVIELFSGAGLFGYAFQKNGFKLSGAFERNPVAAATYSKNVAHEVKICDLLRQRPEGKAEVLLAGPPCQGWSSLGSRNPKDPRNALGLIIPEWAKTTGAQVVVIENVVPFLKSQIWFRLRERFSKYGYETFFWVANAADVGAPQRRVRSFTVFSKRGRPNFESYSKSEPKTVRDAFANLPDFPNAQMQHYTLPRSKFALRRIRQVPPNGDIRDLARHARHLVAPSWFRTKGKIIDIWGRMGWDQTSPTIRTGFLNPSRGRFLHPEEDRPISFREGARLQMVPDDFYFEGGPGEIAKQIGNGVCLAIGQAMARAVRPLFI